MAVPRWAARFEGNVSMTFSLTINLLFIIGLVGGVLALIDGISRVRGRAALLGVLQIIFAVLFLLSLFFAGIPLGNVLLAFITVVLLILALAFRGGRAGVGLVLVALILLIIWLVLGPHAISIPGVNA
jgi:hypothetical protein